MCIYIHQLKHTHLHTHTHTQDGGRVRGGFMITRTKDKHETEFQQLNLTMKHTSDCAQAV